MNGRCLPSRGSFREGSPGGCSQSCTYAQLMAAKDDGPFLRRKRRPPSASVRRERIAAVDLFAGCGGLSIGLWEAARRRGVNLEVPLSVDIDPVMASTFRRNLPGSGAVAARVEELFGGDPGQRVTEIERA